MLEFAPLMSRVDFASITSQCLSRLNDSAHAIAHFSKWKIHWAILGTVMCKRGISWSSLVNVYGITFLACKTFLETGIRRLTWRPGLVSQKRAPRQEFYHPGCSPVINSSFNVSYHTYSTFGKDTVHLEWVIAKNTLLTLWVSKRWSSRNISCFPQPSLVLQNGLLIWNDENEEPEARGEISSARHHMFHSHLYKRSSLQLTRVSMLSAALFLFTTTSLESCTTFQWS